MLTVRPAVAIFVFGLACAAPCIARAQDVAAEEDPAVVKLRERFREGFEKYRDGKYGEAILVWNPIYKELGPAKGYRLSLNLARAFDQIHDEPRAADHYEAYLQEVEVRAGAGETLEPVVLKQRDEANERITELRAKLSRLHFRGEEVLVAVDAGEVRVGRGTSYVAPGKHAIVFRPATPEQARVDVETQAGAVLDVEAPAVAERITTTVAAPMRWETRYERPFPKSVIVIGAAATAVSFILPAVLYANAWSTEDEYNAASQPPVTVASLANASSTRDTYSSQKTAAYASWALPALLGTATVALALYWYYGEKSVRSPVASIALGRGGLIF